MTSGRDQSDPVAVTRDKLKRQAALASIDRVTPGIWLGLGTGSTASWLVKELGERVKGGLQLKGTVSSSSATRALAEQCGLPGGTLEEAGELDLYIDGADEICGRQLVKGGGGALLHEKILAASSRRFIVLADDGKEVAKLGDFGVPIEIIPLARPLVVRRIEALGGQATLRKKDDSEFLTDEKNWVLDCDFGPLESPARLAEQLSAIPGVVEHGLFIDMAHEVVLAGEKGVTWQS